jgi:hypothetical protein
VYVVSNTDEYWIIQSLLTKIRQKSRIEKNIFFNDLLDSSISLLISTWMISGNHIVSQILGHYIGCAMNDYHYSITGK